MEDEAKVTVGGIIAEKTEKKKKNDKAMAFLTLEDLVGSVEIIVFSKQFEKYNAILNEDEKIFVTGRATCEENKDAKVIAETITAFKDATKRLWIKYANRAEYDAKEPEVRALLDVSDGKDTVKIYLEEEKMLKELPPSRCVFAGEELQKGIEEILGEGRVKITW